MTLCLPLQDYLDLLVKDNEHLKAEVKDLLNSSALGSARDQGKISLLLVCYWYFFKPFSFTMLIQASSDCICCISF